MQPIHRFFQNRSAIGILVATTLVLLLELSLIQSSACAPDYLACNRVWFGFSLPVYILFFSWWNDAPPQILLIAALLSSMLYGSIGYIIGAWIEEATNRTGK
jgi:hypothetical protein